MGKLTSHGLMERSAGTGTGTDRAFTPIPDLPHPFFFVCVPVDLPWEMGNGTRTRALKVGLGPPTFADVIFTFRDDDNQNFHPPPPPMMNPDSRQVQIQTGIPNYGGCISILFTLFGARQVRVPSSVTQ